MNVARVFVFLALALVVVAFVVTWLSFPGGQFEQKNLTSGEWVTRRIGYPARLFRFGLSEKSCSGNFCLPPVYRRISLHDVKTRLAIFYGGLAAAIILVGLAFGAARRSAPRGA